MESLEASRLADIESQRASKLMMLLERADEAVLEAEANVLPIIDCQQRARSSEAVHVSGR